MEKSIHSEQYAAFLKVFRRVRMARKNAAAVALGKRRMELITPEERAELGRKGGKAKVAKGLATLGPKRRAQIARKAAAARWGKKA